MGFLLLIFVFVGSLRYTGGDLEWSNVLHKLEVEIILGVDALQRLLDVIPDKFDFFGWDGVWMPFAALAPGNQKILTYILKDDLLQLNFKGGGFVPSVVGWLYISFSAIGVQIGMFLMGFTLKFFYELMCWRRNEYSIIVYSYLATYYIVILRSGFNEIWPIFVVLVLLFLNVFCRMEMKMIYGRRNT